MTLDDVQTVTLRARGALSALSASTRTALMDRSQTQYDIVRERTRGIIARVRTEGDAALFAFAREFDGVALESLEIPSAAWSRALDALDPLLRQALQRASSESGSSNGRPERRAPSWLWRRPSHPWTGP